MAICQPTVYLMPLPLLMPISATAELLARASECWMLLMAGGRCSASSVYRVCCSFLWCRWDLINAPDAQIPVDDIDHHLWIIVAAS